MFKFDEIYVEINSNFYVLFNLNNWNTFRLREKTLSIMNICSEDFNTPFINETV